MFHVKHRGGRGEPAWGNRRGGELCFDVVFTLLLRGPLVPLWRSFNRLASCVGVANDSGDSLLWRMARGSWL